MSGPLTKLNGTTVSLRWPEHNLFCILDRFQDRSGVSKAELSAYLDGEPPRLLTQGQLNLNSLQGRASFARRLDELCPGVPWDVVLENIAVNGLQLRRRGEPVVELSAAGASEPVRYRVNPLCFEGHPSLLFSDGGSGKSWVGLLGALLVETGGCIGSALRAVQGRSLLLDWEQDRSIFDDRFRQVARAHPEWTGAKPLYKRMLSPLADDVPTLLKTIEEKGVTFILIDSLGPAAGGDICSAETAMRTMQAIRMLGVTVLCTAHVSKGSEGASPYGSVYFRNLARSAWRLDSVQEGDRLRMALTHDKSNFGRLRAPVGLSLNFAADAVQVTSFDPQAEPVTEPDVPIMQRILQALAQTGPQTAETLAGYIGSRSEPVKVALSKEKGGRVHVVEKRGKQYVWALREIPK